MVEVLLQQRQLRSQPAGVRPGAAAQVLHQPRLLRLPHHFVGCGTSAGQSGLPDHPDAERRRQVQLRQDRRGHSERPPQRPVPEGPGADPRRPAVRKRQDRTGGRRLDLRRRLCGLCVRRDQSDVPRQSRHRYGRRHLQRLRRPAGLHRPHQCGRQHPHYRSRHPARADADRRRRLQPRPDGTVAQQSARAGLLQGRDDRRDPRQRPGPEHRQRQRPGTAHRRTFGRGRLQLGRFLYGEPGHFRAELPRSGPERRRPAGVGFAASTGRFPLHRA